MPLIFYIIYICLVIIICIYAVWEKSTCSTLRRNKFYLNKYLKYVVIFVLHSIETFEEQIYVLKDHIICWLIRITSTFIYI